MITWRVEKTPPPTRTIERIETELGWEFIQIYGLTETSPLLTVNRMRSEWDDLPPEEQASKLVRAGQPAIGCTVRIDDDGEVLVRSNVVLQGYWDQPEETAIALRDGWFYTGDGGAVGDDGYLTIQDRKKDVIITGGENVSSIEVVVVRTPGSELTEQELIDYCKAKVARFKAPSTIEFRDELARTATGKLQKFKLRAPYWEGRDRQVN